MVKKMSPTMYSTNLFQSFFAAGHWTC